jgi:hypothetical protein
MDDKPVSNFAGKMMNLQAKPMEEGYSVNINEIAHKAFLVGHKQARHQAAELALKADALIDSLREPPTTRIEKEE